VCVFVCVCVYVSMRVCMSVCVCVCVMRPFVCLTDLMHAAARQVVHGLLKLSIHNAIGHGLILL